MLIQCVWFILINSCTDPMCTIHFNFFQERERQFEAEIRRVKGFEVKRMLEDGNCLFRAVADQVYGDSEAYDLIRQMCIDYMVWWILELISLWWYYDDGLKSFLLSISPFNLMKDLYINLSLLFSILDWIECQSWTNI